jgi:hypothetical protein
MLRGEGSYETDVANSTRSSSKTGLKNIDLANGIHVGRTYHCPVCGNSGKVSGTMDSIEAYDSSGVKQSGMKYYPGDKGDKVV